ncbi:MAG: hypothetical protein U0840_25940 [Gemmataceae bacterium]
MEELVIAEARVDGGPIMKRIQPRARGTPIPSSGDVPTSI